MISCGIATHLFCLYWMHIWKSFERQEIFGHRRIVVWANQASIVSSSSARLMFQLPCLKTELAVGLPLPVPVVWNLLSQGNVTHCEFSVQVWWLSGLHDPGFLQGWKWASRELDWTPGLPLGVPRIGCWWALCERTCFIRICALCVIFWFILLFRAFGKIYCFLFARPQEWSGMNLRNHSWDNFESLTHRIMFFQQVSATSGGFRTFATKMVAVRYFDPFMALIRKQRNTFAMSLFWQRISSCSHKFAPPPLFLPTNWLLLTVPLWLLPIPAWAQSLVLCNLRACKFYFIFIFVFQLCFSSRTASCCSLLECPSSFWS